MKSFFFFFLLLLGLLPTAEAQSCFPIRRIMDPSARADFRNLCRAAVGCDPACQNIAPNKLINCSTSQDANRLLSGENIGRRLLGCARAFFVDSMVDLANTVIELIKTLVGASVSSFMNIVRFMTDEDFRASAMRRANGMSSLGSAFLTSAVRNFSTEYERNFNAARARGVSIFNAPLAALGPTLMEPFLKLVVNTVSQIAESQISQFKCLNGPAKLEALCAMAGGFIMPPAILFTAIKHGARAVTAMRGADGYFTAARRTFTATTRPRPPVALTVAAPARPPRPRAPVARAAERPAARPAPAPRREPTRAPERPRREQVADDSDAPIVEAAEDLTEGVTGAADAAEAVETSVQVADSVADSRAITPDDLRRAGALSDTSRVAAAETTLGRALTDAEKSAILDAHYVGIKGPDGQLLPLEDRRGFGTFILSDIRQKAEILRRAGFSRDEIRELMERGITGSTAGLQGIASDVAEATARREAILAGNGDGLRPNANSNGRLEPSRDLYELEIESVVAARGNLTLAREATGEAAQTASRRAIEAATTSGDPELVIEAAQVYANSGGDMALLVADNRSRITALEAQLANDSSNQALKSQLMARRAIKRRFDAPEPPPVAKVAPEPIPAPPAVVAPVRAAPLVRATGEFISEATEKIFEQSIKGDGLAARETLNALSQIGVNPPLFNVVNKVIAENFNGNGWPDVAKAVGRRAGTLPPAEELRLLQTLNQNFFKAEVNTRGVARTLAQEYKDRALGGNLFHFERVQRNLNDRIRELGGTP